MVNFGCWATGSPRSWSATTTIPGSKRNSERARAGERVRPDPERNSHLHAVQVLRGHFDFATSMGLKIERVETLKQGMSDHMPILVTADYAD